MYHAYCCQQAVAGGQQIGSRSLPPYNVLPYSPLHYVVVGHLGKVLGGDLFSAKQAGRLVSLFMTGVTALMVFLLARGLGVSRRYAFIGAVLSLLCESIQWCATLIRPDAFACALTLVGVWLALQKGCSWFSGACFGLVFGIKYSYFVAPCLLFWGGWEGKGFRRLPFLGGLFLGCMTWWLLAERFLGPHWGEGLSLPMVSTPKLQQPFFFLAWILEDPSALPLLFGLSCIALRPADKRVRFFCVYACLSFFFSALALVKPGAGAWYLLEPFVVGCLLTAWTLQQLEERLPALWTSFALVVVCGLLFTVAEREAARSRDVVVSQRQRDSAAKERLVALLQETRGPILSTRSDLYFRSGHEPWLHTFDLVCGELSRGLIDPKAMESLFSKQVFGAVVLEKGEGPWKLMPPVLAEALKAHYRFEGEFEENLLYLPKGNSQERGD